MAHIIDGKAIATSIREDLAEEVAAMDFQPGLAVIIVGEDAASQVYVRNKGRAAEACGIHSIIDRLPADTSQEYLLKRINNLNDDPQVHGILVQLPVPAHIDATAIINAIFPEKDVDGFHVVNAGKLVTGQDCLTACTPQGCIILLKEVASRQSLVASGNGEASNQQAETSNLSGLHAVVIGRSNIVGKPVAQMLLNEGCTVTICHSKTKDVAAECKRADIIIAAVGIEKFVKADWVKQGATVIDVGINRGADGKLVGDVDFDAVKEVAGAITPVPGGVGPMTIACLLRNTVQAAINSTS